MSEISYRQVEERDHPAVKNIYVELDLFYRQQGLNFPPVEDVGQVWLDSFARTLGKFTMLYVAEKDGLVVGFMLARVKRLPPYWGGGMAGTISDIYVSPKARNTGIARGLMDHCLAWLRQQGVASVDAQVQVKNSASRALFASFGFEPELEQVRLVWGEGSG